MVSFSRGQKLWSLKGVAEWELCTTKEIKSELSACVHWGDEKRVKLLSEVRLCMGQKKANGLCCGDSESENVSIPVRQLFLVPSLFALILLGEASSGA